MKSLKTIIILFLLLSSITSLKNKINLNKTFWKSLITTTILATFSDTMDIIPLSCLNHIYNLTEENSNKIKFIYSKFDQLTNAHSFQSLFKDLILNDDQSIKPSLIPIINNRVCQDYKEFFKINKTYFTYRLIELNLIKVYLNRHIDRDQFNMKHLLHSYNEEIFNETYRSYLISEINNILSSKCSNTKKCSINHLKEIVSMIEQDITNINTYIEFEENYSCSKFNKIIKHIIGTDSYIMLRSIPMVVFNIESWRSPQCTNEYNKLPKRMFMFIMKVVLIQGSGLFIKTEYIKAFKTIIYSLFVHNTFEKATEYNGSDMVEAGNELGISLANIIKTVLSII